MGDNMTIEKSEMIRRVLTFTQKCEELVQTHFMERGYKHSTPYIKARFGRRYAKLVEHEIQKSDGEARRVRVYCFIDMTNGNILKAATWNAPAKHARGSIMKEDFGMSVMTPYGAPYMS